MTDGFDIKEVDVASTWLLDTLLQILFTYALFYLVKSFYDIISPNLPN